MPTDKTPNQPTRRSPLAPRRDKPGPRIPPPPAPPSDPPKDQPTLVPGFGSQGAPAERKDVIVPPPSDG